MLRLSSRSLRLAVGLPHQKALLRRELFGETRRSILVRGPRLVLVDVSDEQAVLPDLKGNNRNQVVAHDPISSESLLVCDCLRQSFLQHL